MRFSLPPRRRSLYEQITERVIRVLVVRGLDTVSRMAINKVARGDVGLAPYICPAISEAALSDLDWGGTLKAALLLRRLCDV